MNHRRWCSLNGFKGLSDNVITALCQNLHRHIIRNHIFIDQLAQKFIFGFTGSRETDFNLLEADLYKHLIEFDLFFKIHRDDQCLISITQVHTAPCRCLFHMVFFDPAVVTCRGGIITRCVLCCVHHRNQSPFPSLYESKKASVSHDMSERRKL